MTTPTGTEDHECTSHNWRCRLCVNVRQREWKAQRREKVNEGHRRYSIKSKYGLSFDQYLQLFDDQYYQCLICKESVLPFSGVRGAAVDHNHVTGKVRGILCANCNVGLGMFKEDLEILEQAIKYIKRNNDPDL